MKKSHTQQNIAVNFPHAESLAMKALIQEILPFEDKQMTAQHKPNSPSFTGIGAQAFSQIFMPKRQTTEHSKQKGVFFRIVICFYIT